MDLLADTGENDDVRIDRHTDGEQDTCNTGQCQRDIKRIEYDRHEYDIDAECQRCAQTGQPVDRAHKDRDQCKAQDSCRFAGPDRILTELGADDLGAEPFQFYLQSADTDVGCKALGLFDGALTGNDRAAVRDRVLDSGHADEPAVIVDADRLAGCICLCGGIRKFLLAFVRKCQGYDDLLVVHVVVLVSGLGLLDVGSFQDYISVRLELFQILLEHVIGIAFRIRAELIVLIAALVSLPDKIQRAGLSQFIQDPVGLFYAGNTGDLDIDAVSAFPVYLGLRAVLIDTLLKLVDSV